MRSPLDKARSNDGAGVMIEVLSADSVCSLSHRETFARFLAGESVKWKQALSSLDLRQSSAADLTGSPRYRARIGKS